MVLTHCFCPETIDGLRPVANGLLEGRIRRRISFHMCGIAGALPATQCRGGVD
jgi:hypothetical protein